MPITYDEAVQREANRLLENRTRVQDHFVSLPQTEDNRVLKESALAAVTGAYMAIKRKWKDWREWAEWDETMAFEEEHSCTR